MWPENDVNLHVALSRKWCPRPGWEAWLPFRVTIGSAGWQLALGHRGLLVAFVGASPLIPERWERASEAAFGVSWTPRHSQVLIFCNESLSRGRLLLLPLPA